MNVRLIAAMVVAMLAASGPAWAEDAAALLRASEQKILGAEALRVRFTVSQPLWGMKIEGRGTLLLARGNRMHRSIVTKAGTEKQAQTIVCDGTRTVHVQRGRKQEIPTFPLIERMERMCLARGSLQLPSMMGGLPRTEPELDAAFRISNPQLGPLEQVNGHQAQVVTYTLQAKGAIPLEVRAWIDVKTKLPLRRELRSSKPRLGPMVIDERYLEITLDPALPANAFDPDRAGEGSGGGK